jgi:hypothetical protein
MRPQAGKHLLPLSLTAFDPDAICLSAFPDRAVEAWYHPSIA